MSKDFHALQIEEVLKGFNVDPELGLGDEEVERGLLETGPNLIQPLVRRSWAIRLLEQFKNVLIYVLLSASLVTILLGHYTDAIVIFGVVLVNALIGYIQEGRAERALDAVRAMMSPEASVIRNGRRRTIKAENIVPGDIVELKAGDRVPADVRLLLAKNLLVQESALTGESNAVEKSHLPVSKAAILGDRRSMAYGGTFVVYGFGKGIVTATGENTEIGRIGTLLSGVQKLSTPLIRQIDAFSRKLTVAILGLAIVTFAFGVWIQDFTSSEMFLASVGLVVAAIPEGLPAVMTIALALGVTRMAKRNAIIRRLPAVETLGSVSVICSDKTGTLTRNELMVQTVVTPENIYTVSGSGYSPIGVFSVGGQEISANHDRDLKFISLAAALCNDAEISHESDDWRLHGNPTDGALVTLAMKAGYDINLLRKSKPRTDIIPFDSTQKFMATLHQSQKGPGYIFIKGAAERILDICTFEKRGDKDQSLNRDRWQKEIDTLAGEAQRVLAIAWMQTSEDKQELQIEDLEEGLSLLGLFGLIDPPRPEAIEAIARCRDAGISVKMITGDHLLTAKAIGQRFDLGVEKPSENKLLSGTRLDQLTPDQFTMAARNCEIFARTTPEHKLKLVQALQRQGMVVAMTGDGVNDAPALKRADIGVAMGIKGTEAAKETAEMVLADDNFATIVHAVEEGRTVYNNLIKTILFVVPTSAGEAMTVVAAILMAQALPITPLQILWINMVTMITLGLALAFEKAEPDVMSRPPREPNEPILSTYLTWRVISMSILILLMTFGFYEYMRSIGASLELARTVAVNSLVFAEIANLVNCRSITASTLSWRKLIENKVVLAAIFIVLILQLFFTYSPSMQLLFDTSDMNLTTWLWILVAGLGVFFIIESEKFVARKYLHIA